MNASYLTCFVKSIGKIMIDMDVFSIKKQKRIYNQDLNMATSWPMSINNGWTLLQQATAHWSMCTPISSMVGKRKEYIPKQRLV